jgi:predicted RNA-binding Zn ribbon-like protein
MKSFEMKMHKRIALRHAFNGRITDAIAVEKSDTPRNGNSAALVELIKANKIKSVRVCSWAGCSWANIDLDNKEETI